MTLKKLLLVGSIAGLVYWLTGWVINFFFLKSYMISHLGITSGVIVTRAIDAVKPGPPVIGGIVAGFFAGILLAFVFMKTNVTHKIAGALRGAVIGLFFKSALDTTLYANTNLYDTKFIIADVLVFVFQSILAGIVIVMVMEKMYNPLSEPEPITNQH